MTTRKAFKPSPKFLGLTRLPDQPVGERKFVPTVKRPGEYEFRNGKIVEVR